jgi:methyl-accepting chemotaxis protein
VKSLNSKLAVFVTVILAVSAMLLTGIAYFRMRAESLEQLQREVKAVADRQASLIGEWLGAKRRIIAATAPVGLESDPRPSLMRAKIAGEFGPVYIGMPDKRMILADPNTPLPPNFDPTVRPWWKLALERDALVITAPFMSVSDRKLVVTIAEPIKRDGTLVGVIGANVILDSLVQSVLSLKVVGDSYAFLVAKDGTVIAHREGDLVLKPIATSIPELAPERIAAIAASGDMVDVSDHGHSVFAVIRPVPGSEWYFGLVVDRAVALAPLNALLYMLIGTTVVVVLVALFLSGLGMRKLLNDVVRLRDAMLNIARGEGDLTVRLAVTSADEIGQAAGAFNKFLERLHAMFKSVKEQTEHVTRDMSIVAASTSQVVSDFGRQTEDLTATAATIEQVTVSITHIADTVRDTESAMQRADMQSSTSAESVEHVTREIGRIADTVGNLSAVVGRLGSRSDEIAGIVGAIKGIAEQTNLLALNAAIEAARAGEQGRGFAVVADEVRKLAERTAASTVEISHMIDSIRGEMTNALTGMDEARRIVDSGVELAEQTTAGISSIREQVSDVVSRMSNISDATSEQASATTEMAKRAEQVNTMIQSSSNALREADEALRNANERAAKLAEIVGRFRL